MVVARVYRRKRTTPSDVTVIVDLGKVIFIG